MKRLLSFILLIVAAGCKTAPPPLVPAREPFELVTNSVPVPPGIPKQVIVTKRPKSRVASAPVPADKWILVRWDPSSESNITYQVSWTRVKDSKGYTGVYVYNLGQTKVDLVQLFNLYQVPNGRYQVSVSCVTDTLLSSPEVVACYLLWNGISE